MKIGKLICFVFLILPFGVKGQYVPNSNQPFQFAPVYNPAFTGIENFMDTKLGYRHQWGAFKENAPQFSNLTLNFRIKQPLDLQTNGLRGSRGDFSRLVPKSKLNKQGLGFNVFTEKSGPILKYGVGTQYAFHLPVSSKYTFSMGAGVMYEYLKVSGEFYWGEENVPDPIREQVEQGNGNQGQIWARLGVLLYSDKFYIGGTYYAYSMSEESVGFSFENQFYKGGIQTGYSFPLSDDFEFRPSIWALWLVDNSFAIDYQTKFYFQDKTWFGITYRDVQSGVFTGGFNFNSMLSASYAYEFATGKLRRIAGSTHEIVLSARLKNLKRAKQFTW
jgi:type IX secretion system PorP/SprF family membrane protein